jgi:hypothetical protein
MPEPTFAPAMKIQYLLMMVAAFALVCSNGCTPAKKTIAAPNWRDEVQQLQKEGWKKEETLGVTGDAVMSSSFKDDKAPTLTAFWVMSEKQSSKQFPQMGKKYLLLTFSKADGDSFVVVFSRASGS